MLFLPILGNFWCLKITLVTFSSNLNNFERKKSNISQKKSEKKLDKKSKYKNVK